MASRPVFVPSTSPNYFVDEVVVEFPWHPGMAPVQKRKNVVELHQAARQKHGLSRLLEISSKSEEKVGRHLSAFNLKIAMKDGSEVHLESAFQGSKIFLEGGPYQDLYYAEPGDARRDPRLKSSGKIVGFKLAEDTFPSEPMTGFYDWLYLKALSSHIAWIRQRVTTYQGYTDIEFNPDKSINCQARSFALLLALDKRGLLDLAASDYWNLTNLFHAGRYWKIADGRVNGKML